MFEGREVREQNGRGISLFVIDIEPRARAPARRTKIIHYPVAFGECREHGRRCGLNCDVRRGCVDFRSARPVVCRHEKRLMPCQQVSSALHPGVGLASFVSLQGARSSIETRCKSLASEYARYGRSRGEI